MGLFKKATIQVFAAAFDKVMEHGAKESESEFLDSLNLIVKAIEVDETYSTNEKLKIYELLSQLSNCEADERKRYD